MPLVLDGFVEQPQARVPHARAQQGTQLPQQRAAHRRVAAIRGEVELEPQDTPGFLCGRSTA
ncbi:hypothetical protein [Amycolatopsis sp. CA-128772]|uniref:hypothetical protein n=1 Tax=Amycolatopsis sp. CA-128772 TaxID=2073159 RepID=UPI001E2B6C37|nr:hypothetical protein [Amycolatopsis sp. CA-128772]